MELSDNRKENMEFADKMTLSKDRVDKRLIDLYKLRRVEENHDIDDDATERDPYKITRKRIHEVSLESFASASSWSSRSESQSSPSSRHQDSISLHGGLKSLKRKDK